ncbi:helix-turn-helix domain-containing protein [Lucifera butyrica]|uniref:helix-turn-helix domain-containing protein n=1 Tax=Lucifera butyrica TaxID=1351585 RepID=UPI002437174F|nr:helix-turn-helix transcriptional regulator [Lucifera butyrica]
MRWSYVERIRNLREDKDMAQVQIAMYLNCSQRIYSNYERGDVDIPTGILIKLADLHNTSTDYLLNRTNRKKTYPKD